MIAEFSDENDDERIVYFGVNNVITMDDGTYHLLMHRTIDFSDNHQEKEFFEDRQINFVNEESNKEVIDIIEFLADNIFSNNTEVVVGLTHEFDTTIRAIKACKEDRDVDIDSVQFIGDTSVIE